MALILYGSPRSRTMRSLWVLSELELSYTLVPLEWDDPALKSPQFLALNPAGAIPTLVDDGIVVAESMAIALYLARRYGGAARESLYPAGEQIEADIWRWSLWAQGQLEPWVQQDARFRAVRVEFGAAVSAEVAKSLAIFERALADRLWLAADRFTIADLNVAGVLSPSRAQHLPLANYPAVADWLLRYYARPAAVAVRRKYSA